MKTAAVAVVVVALAAGGSGSGAGADRFVVHRLVSDRGDAQLVNPWGIVSSASTALWVANEARSSSTTYSSSGHKQVVTLAVAGGPTGVAFNAGNGFLVRAGGVSAPARLIYACEDGMIRAWSPEVPRTRKPWSSQSEVTIDPGATGTVFRGVTLAGGRLYATDFHNARVLVFDSRWRPISRPGAFVDPSISSWYAPFGIQAFGNRVFVTYAYRAPPSGNDAPTGGYVDEFDLEGRLIAHIGNAGELDEPWGLALAPRGFGRLAGDLLVASFGTGRVSVYTQHGGGWKFHGDLPVTVPGVWGIAFGAGGAGGPRTTLYFTAGPHIWHASSEEDVHGVLGAVTTVG